MEQVTRRLWLLAGFGCPLAAALSAQELAVRFDTANLLHISAPGLRFLVGKPLERLKDGATVAFLGQLTLSLDANATVAVRAMARFAMSYDIWEERFSVTRFSIARNEVVTRSASHLAPQAAEAWCLDQLTLDASQLPPNRPIWVRFDIHVEDGRDASQVIGEPGINITRLIELFSRPARELNNNAGSWMPDHFSERSCAAGVPDGHPSQ